MPRPLARTNTIRGRMKIRSRPFHSWKTTMDTASVQEMLRRMVRMERRGVSTDPRTTRRGTEGGGGDGIDFVDRLEGEHVLPEDEEEPHGAVVLADEGAHRAEELAPLRFGLGGDVRVVDERL